MSKQTDNKQFKTDYELHILLKAVFDSLKKLKNNGNFFISSIEFGWDLDGEKYEKEIDELIKKLAQFIKRK